MNPTDDEPGRPLEQEPQILTGADSHNGKDTTSSRRGSDVSYTISTRPPLLPLPPFDQFAKETAPQLDLPDGKELLDRLRDMWDAIEPAERLFWEAQYGRQMLEFTKQKARWEKEHPTPQKAGFKFNPDAIDFGKIAGLWNEFAGKAVAEVFGLGGQEDTVSQVGENYDDNNRDDEVQNENSAPRGRQQNQKRAPRDKLQVLYRAEIYRVRESSRYSSSRRPEAILDRMYEQTSEIDVVPASRLLTAPIFEITTMYDAARGKKDNILGGFRRLMDDDKVPTAETVKPGDSIQVRVAAGILLTIGSDIILDTIRSVAEHYHDLAWEGDELVVPEPFCVLFHYRDEILARRDQLQSGLKKKRIQYDNGDANLQDRESTEPESSDLEDEVPDPALHIDMLYEYVDNRYAKALRQEDERLRKEPPTCTYAWSWRLFKPGELVYTWDDNVLVACVVESHTLKGLWDYDKNTKKPSVKPGRLKKKRNLEFKDELRAVVITVSHMEYDGTYLGRRIRKITIWPFEGEKDIKSLPAFPAKFWDDESTRDRMIERGKRYCSFTKRTHCQYHGLTMSSPRRMVHSRIILDSETYYSEYSPELIPRFHLPPEEIGDQSDDSDSSSSDIPVRRRRRYDEPRYIDTTPYSFGPGSRKSLNTSSYRKRLDSAYHFSRRSDTSSNARIVDPKQSVELSDELYMLCPRQVYGYILKERRWDLLDVEKITPCEFNENIMDDLVLSDEAKRLIQALSSTHAIQKGVISTDTRDKASIRGRWSADFIQNKGDGQIILLHGRPGVGKTSTAECVAEITHRPLIAITCGDLGTTATAVEDNLNDWLRLGTRWEAVLLFDEADVYLESRQQGDFERNTLVSVFLRALEYYQGLLFLTSNRVGSFDEAILSRVHIVLHFPSFNDAEREQIWETSFRKLNEERKDIVLGVGILEYAYGHQDIKSLSWNGREIRNAFNTMVALAEWDARDGKRLTKAGKIELQRKHLQQVVKMSGLFKEYLLRTRGLNESTLAKVQAIRDDEFDPTVN